MLTPVFRQCPSGPVMTYPADKVGQAIIIQPDGTLGPSAGGGGGGPTFSDVMFVDAGTSGSPGDGSLLAPWKKLGDALAASGPNTVLYCTAESYTAEGILSTVNSASIIGMSASGSNGLSIQGITTTHGLTLENCTALAGVTTSSTFTAIDSTVFGIAGTGSAISLTRSTVVGAITGATLNASNSTIVGNITLTSGTASFQNTTFQSAPVLTFSGSSGTANFDAASYNSFMSAGGTIANGSILSNDPNVPKVQLTSPQTLSAGGGGAYVTLTADGGAAMSFDCTGLTNSVKVEVGIDATETNAGVHSELRANQTYSIAVGVPTLLNNSTSFSPSTVGGNPTLQLAVVGNTIALQGYKEAASGADHKYVGKMYVQVVTVS